MANNKSCKNCVYLWILYNSGHKKYWLCDNETENTIVDRKAAKFKACKLWKEGLPLHESEERDSLGFSKLVKREPFECCCESKLIYL